MANSGYYTEPKLNATGGGGSSLTIREADGTPSGVVTELVFPNTSVAIASGVGTLSLVASSDVRLGVIYDIPNAHVALECADSEWNFVDATTRDNLRTALSAAAATHTHGNITNAGAIGTTADLPISTTASGVINTRTVPDFRGLLSLNTERIQVALSANGQNISSGTKKGVVPILVNGNITAFRIDCDPANEPSAIAVQCDLNRINRTTGVATSVLSSVASIATGDNTGSGTINGTQSVAVGDMLTIDIDQGSDGRELIASITITLT